MANLQPIVGVGVVVYHDNRVLLVKRKYPPKQNLWAVPGGKVKFGENLQHAARREVLEETGIHIEVKQPVQVLDVIEMEGETKYHYVVIDFLAHYIAGDVCAKDDALAADWFAIEELADIAIDQDTYQLLQHINDTGLRYVTG